MTDIGPTALAHHVWATGRLLDACAGLSEEQLATTVDGTYGSIIDTLRHVVGGDASYLALLGGGATDEIDESALDVRGLREAMRAHGPAWEAVVAADRDADEDVVRSNPGFDSHAPLGVRLAQVLHHGSDHRSQVCTALHQLGVQPPDLDVWAWGETQGTVTSTTLGG